MTIKLRYLFVSCLILWTQLVASQTINLNTDESIVSVSELLRLYTEAHGLEFAFDVTRMSNSYINYSDRVISFEDFKRAVRTIGITIEQDAANTYLVQKHTKTYPFCAQIKHLTTQLPLPNVQVFSGDTYLGLTDFSGEINLELTLGQRIELRNADMYIKYYVVYPQTDCSSIFLADNIQDLEEVVLTNYLTRGIVKNKNSSITVSPKSLAILPGLVEPDVFQSLQLVPGINSPEEDPASLHIRGGTPDQNLLLWDGIRLYQNSHFFDQITSFNPYITKKADVYRGGTSVRYGDRISGVIDIQSDDDLFTNFKAGGGLNALNGDAYLKIPVSRKFGILLAGRRSLTDIYRSSTFNQLSTKVFQNSRLDVARSTDQENNPPLEYFFYDANLKFIYQTDTGHTYTASFIAIENQLENTNEGLINQNDFEIEDDFSQMNAGGSLRWHREKANKTTKDFNLSFSNYRSDYNFKYAENDGVDSQVTALRNNSIVEFNTDLSYDIPIGDHHHWLLGNQFSFTNVDNRTKDLVTNTINPEFNSEDFFEKSRTAIIGYSEYRYDSNALLINLGVRGEINSLLGSYLEPRVYGSLKLSNPLRITASIERKNQTFSQLFASQVEPAFYNFLPAVNRFWSIQPINSTETNFAIQRSNQYTFGMLFKENGWDLEVETYYKTIANTIPQNDT
ncbi:MAG: TonB-dependent receptor plug domain-containing protein, partial [Leeuwenhoekiella sp.]